ncbi:acylphosphatase [Malonomonas rubra DSM 5091]|uniref:acylphosphatase n=1 Tax=Malonomonas rubra DSM 5091 TaxID=1122189 RepID=A0A1M6E6Z2_MALRU|nr:acylphosphatase [Malonomonas rubra]SHI81149.1 acylphosphatase [Malonomonas rubra DSM 5091]
MAAVRAIVRVTGRVQGVWFRQSTKQTADRYAVAGWVRNNPDFSVSAIFEGDEPAVKTVVEWCRQGPQMAQVDDVDVEWQSATGEFDQFSVLR